MRFPDFPRRAGTYDPGFDDVHEIGLATPATPQTPAGAMAQQAVAGLAAQQAAAAEALVHISAVGAAERINEEARREQARAQLAQEIAAAAQPIPQADLVRNPLLAS